VGGTKKTPLIQIATKEHYEIMENFDRRFKVKPAREPKEMWAKGVIYCDGHVNKDFLLFREGYSLAKATYQN